MEHIKNLNDCEIISQYENFRFLTTYAQNSSRFDVFDVAVERMKKVMPKLYCYLSVKNKLDLIKFYESCQINEPVFIEQINNDILNNLASSELDEFSLLIFYFSNVNPEVFKTHRANFDEIAVSYMNTNSHINELLLVLAEFGKYGSESFWEAATDVFVNVLDFLDIERLSVLIYHFGVEQRGSDEVWKKFVEKTEPHISKANDENQVMLYFGLKNSHFYDHKINMQLLQDKILNEKSFQNLSLDSLVLLVKELKSDKTISEEKKKAVYDHAESIFSNENEKIKEE